MVETRSRKQDTMSRLASFILSKLRYAPVFRGRNRAMKHLLSYVDEAESFYGPKLTVLAGDNTFYASYFARYGQELVDLINALPNDGVFIEFGANTGVFSLIAAHHLSSGDVISVEPNAFVFRHLTNNKRINNAHNMVVLNFSIDQQTNLVPFKFDATHTGKGHIALTGEKADGHITLIQADQFKKLLPNLFGRTVLCKIDTEGAELLILQALRSCGLINLIDKFHIEIDNRYLSKRGHSPEDIYELALACNFTPQTDRRGHQHYDEIFHRGI